MRDRQAAGLHFSLPVTSQGASMLLLRHFGSPNLSVYGDLKGHKAQDCPQAAAAKAARAAARAAPPSAPSKAARLNPPQLRLSLRRRIPSIPPRCNKRLILGSNSLRRRLSLASKCPRPLALRINVYMPPCPFPPWVDPNCDAPGGSSECCSESAPLLPPPLALPPSRR